MSQAGRGRVLDVIVCGAGPASEVGRLIDLAHERGWDVQVIAGQVSPVHQEPVRSPSPPPPTVYLLVSGRSLWRCVRPLRSVRSAGRVVPVVDEGRREGLGAACDQGDVGADEHEARPGVRVGARHLRVEGVDADGLPRGGDALEGAGGGVRDAASGAALQALAERLGAPVITSRNGKGAISDRHPLALSRLAGAEVLENADVVLAVGTRFITMTGQPVIRPGRHRLIAINADPADVRAPREFEVAVIADVKVALEAVANSLPDGGRAAPTLDAHRKRERDALRVIAPQVEWLQAIRAAMPDDAVLVEELTQIGYAARLAFPVYQAGTYVTPGYQGTLGYGFPTGLGAAVGAGGRQVVSINGDGGFGWALQELSTAAKYNIGLVTVVFRNDAFGRNIGVDLNNPDFVALAREFGVAGERVTTPEGLGDAIRNARGTDAPVLIEVPFGDVPSPWKLLAEPSIG